MDTNEITFYKCKSNDYSSYVKGQIYSKDMVGKYLLNKEDWIPVLGYPNTKQILDCIENGTNKTKVIKALKQWLIVK